MSQSDTNGLNRHKYLLKSSMIYVSKSIIFVNNLTIV